MAQAPRIKLHPVSQRVQVHVEFKLLAVSNQAFELRECGYTTRRKRPDEFLTLSETMTTAPLEASRRIFSLSDN